MTERPAAGSRSRARRDSASQPPARRFWRSDKPIDRSGIFGHATRPSCSPLEPRYPFTDRAVRAAKWSHRPIGPRTHRPVYETRDVTVPKFREDLGFTGRVWSCRLIVSAEDLSGNAARTAADTCSPKLHSLHSACHGTVAWPDAFAVLRR